MARALAPTPKKSGPKNSRQSADPLNHNRGIAPPQSNLLLSSGTVDTGHEACEPDSSVLLREEVDEDSFEKALADSRHVFGSGSRETAHRFGFASLSSFEEVQDQKGGGNSSQASGDSHEASDSDTSARGA